MTNTAPPLEGHLAGLRDLAAAALPLWDVPPDARLRLLNVSENVTFLVEAAGAKRMVLRVHRDGYHSEAAIASELSWIAALRDAGIVPVPNVRKGRDNREIQCVGAPGLGRRRLVLFDHISGRAPQESGDLAPGFEDLGRIAAHCHLHALGWDRPASFERLSWDEDAVFGPAPIWGDWRAAPGVGADVRAVLEPVEALIRARLAAFGKAPARFNLIHADMRLANLLVEDGRTSLIDFDDCGFGWLMYDFAAAISFMEEDPRMPALQAAWLRGYRGVRPLAAEDETEIQTFVMLRRMALLAWIGSHMEAPEPQALAPTFAAGTARLGRTYLDRMGGP